MKQAFFHVDSKGNYSEIKEGDIINVNTLENPEYTHTLTFKAGKLTGSKFNKMKKETQLERDFRDKVNQFCKDYGYSLAKLGNSRHVHYSNIEKLTDFFTHDIGVLTSNVMGRIDKFINEKTSSEFIDEDFLIKLHPELSFKQAESLKRFAANKTITHKECYGTGSKIFPKWKAALEFTKS